MGSTKVIPVQARFIAATNQDLPAMVREGRFRMDLYYRLNVVEISLPPLSARREDIGPLILSFLKKFAQQYNRTCPVLVPDALSILESHSWPGNVRELRNLAERFVVIRQSSRIEPGHIRFARDPGQAVKGSLDNHKPDASGSMAQAFPATKGSLDEFKYQFEVRVLVRALEGAHWNQTLAARKLGCHRNTVGKRIKKFGIKPKRG